MSDAPKKATAAELADQARYVAAFGADMDPDEYPELVAGLLADCDDKIRAIAYVLQSTELLSADLEAQHDRLGSAIKAQKDKANYLDEWGRRLAEEAARLAREAATTAPSPEAWQVYQRAARAVESGAWRKPGTHLQSAPISPADAEVVWAHRTLSVVQDTEALTAAMESRDDPLMAARNVARASGRRVEFFKSQAAAMAAAAEREGRAEAAAKALILATLRKRVEEADAVLRLACDNCNDGVRIWDLYVKLREAPSKGRKPIKAELVQAVASCGDPARVQAAIDACDKAPKHVDAAQGWVRRQVSRRKVACASDWSGKGAVRLPSVDDLPDRFVRTERSVERKKLTDAIKGGEEVPGVRLHTSVTESVRLSK